MPDQKFQFEKDFTSYFFHYGWKLPHFVQTSQVFFSDIAKYIQINKDQIYVLSKT